MFRITTTAVLATAALALPASATAGSLEASAALEAHAVVNSGKALAVAKSSAGKAKELVQRSEAQLHRAYTLSVAQGTEAAAQFSDAAQEQGDKLGELVE